MAILIKRYANRKLYNTETSRYITLKGVGELRVQSRTLPELRQMLLEAYSLNVETR